MAYSLFYRNIIGSYLAFFIPINIICWFWLGQFAGILILVLSCLSIVVTVLKHGILYYNGYIILFGISSYVGYRMFLNEVVSRNQLLTRQEALEGDKNILLSDISKKENDINYARAKVQRYASLKDITEGLSSTLRLEETGALIADRAFSIIGRSDRALLFLTDEEKQEVELFSFRQGPALPPIKSKSGGVFERWVLKQRKPFIIEDMDNDFRFSPDALRDPADKKFKSILCAPLISEMKIIGILRMDSAKVSAYTQDDLRLLNIISDLSALSIENSRLYYKTNELAITDSLTGLYVQKHFKERLDTELAKATVDKGRLSVLMIDLDYFKNCNDKYGHAAGDVLLGRIAQVLKETIEPRQVISRYGGEEFGVILSGVNKRKAIKISEDIRERIENSVFTLRRDQIKITVSVGVSSYPEDGNTAQGLLKTADANLYKAKEKGRNKVWPHSA
jgi:diguanylate cyclase (GGDEF)-like protein